MDRPNRNGIVVERDHLDVARRVRSGVEFASEVQNVDIAQGALITVGDSQALVLGIKACGSKAPDFIFAY